MKDNSIRRSISPQTCDQCPDAPASARCEADYNCTLYVGMRFNPDAVAEHEAQFLPMSEWDNDVAELKRLMKMSDA